MDISEIVKSWISANNPNEEEKELAYRRSLICNDCPSMVRSTIWKWKCNECGCPISKKVFSPKKNSCPLNKWEEVDNEFYLTNQKKGKKTII